MYKYIIILVIILSILACDDYESQNNAVNLDDCADCELIAPDTDESTNVIE